MCGPCVNCACVWIMRAMEENGRGSRRDKSRPAIESSIKSSQFSEQPDRNSPHTHTHQICEKHLCRDFTCWFHLFTRTVPSAMLPGGDRVGFGFVWSLLILYASGYMNKSRYVLFMLHLCPYNIVTGAWSPSLPLLFCGPRARSIRPRARTCKREGARSFGTDGGGSYSM